MIALVRDATRPSGNETARWNRIAIEERGRDVAQASVARPGVRGSGEHRGTEDGDAAHDDPERVAPPAQSDQKAGDAPDHDDDGARPTAPGSARTRP